MNRRGIIDWLVNLWLWGSIATVAAIFLLLVGHIVLQGWRAISLEFLFGAPRGMPLGAEGGIFPAIMGSLALAGISLAVASLLGLATALYLQLYCRNPRIVGLIRVVVQCIAGIPSIVLGLFGYALFVVAMGMGYSLLAGGLTLAIMIFPVVAISAEKAIADVRRELIVASHALGVSRSYTFWHIIWPAAKNDIISGILLGTVWALGATPPIMLTAAVLSAPSPTSLLQPVMALPYHLYILTTEQVSVEKAYGTALVLMVLLLLGYALAFLLFGRQRKER
ncbi:PstA family ABC transporter permease [Desulfurivibrio alkaliphilus]|uniref:Binding-protein-dependent transport systems inner membrane component n=1 Tax=Desulfurivibrio alkaliphilus (strain DSM 19089 / UNIQEM U267 / AHT2) TaxID=589865 RepID=D6Z1H9_DESAT|nr:ABC transporter permease subunit [Desulfurivibrio alkaliphilus]ADH87313.1 binding-protein-dependent transport systems inner membrane component [Desulfurivibrio alkaliphilus AHT 2]